MTAPLGLPLQDGGWWKSPHPPLHWETNEVTGRENWKHLVESTCAHSDWNATAVMLMAPVTCTRLLDNQRLAVST